MAVIQPIIFATIAFYMFRAGGTQRHAALRVARRGDDGRLVDDAVRLGRNDPVAALAGDARAGRRRAARRWRSSTCRSRSRTRSPACTRSRRRSSGDACVFGVPLHLVHPWLFVLVAARDGRRARADGPRARVDLHPLPPRERALEPPRVPGLDRLRPRLLDVAPARLDAADLVGAAAVLGHARDPPRRARRRRLAAARDGARCSGSRAS